MTVTRMTTFRRAQGFILIEVMIAMTIFTAMVTYGLYLQNLEAKAEQGRRVGQQYAAINKAVGNYMVTHYAALENLPVGCSTTTFKVGTSGSFTPMACGLQISSTVNIVNGMQPTVAELVAAGYLPPDKAGVAVGVPSLPMDSVVAEANASTGAASTTKAVARLFINIDRVCLATHSANPGSLIAKQVPGPTGCDPQTTTSLTSLVFNTQPYTFSSMTNFGYASRISAAWSEIGADAAMSNITKGGELKGANFEIFNPVRSATNLGMAGIVAVRNGYGAAYANNHARVDGSNPPTADWSFANNSIKDVNKLTAQSVDAQTVVAKVVDAEALKLGDRIEGNACDASKENVSFGGGTILMCKSGYWTALGAKGTVNGLDYYEFVLNKNSGQNMTMYVNHCPKSGCLEGYSFSSGGPVELITSLKNDEWQPVLVRVADQPNGLNGVTRTNYGFEVTSLGYYKFMFYSGAGFISQIFNAEDAYFVIRFYRINQ
jgi:type II secretory pathway pseudopilin PulG